MVDYTLPLDELPDPLPIEPLSKPFDVTITPPGSKSITNRAYVLAALADGESRIIRPLRADDTDLLLKALCTLGAEALWVPGEGHDGEDVLIKGVNGRFPRGGEINLGDGGTPTRFMIAAACLAAEPVVVDGSKRMRERPVAEGVDMLRQLGAQMEYIEEEGRLPVRVVPSDSFKGGEIEIGKTQSSQYISALMLIGAWLEQGIGFQFAASPTSGSYLWLTLETLRNFGVRTRRNMSSRFAKHTLTWIQIPSNEVKAHDFLIEADASSTTYWALAALVVSESLMVVESLPFWTRQPDFGAIKALDRFGAMLLTSEEPGGHDGISIERGVDAAKRRKKSIDCSGFPDGALSVAVASAITNVATHLTGLHTLRVKECDRLAALETELRKVGCEVETTEDSITIHPISDLEGGAGVPARLDSASSADTEAGKDARAPQPIIIETYNDHRMAMAFAVLGLRVPGIEIRNPAVVSKSYPAFWKDFAKLYGRGSGESATRSDE